MPPRKTTKKKPGGMTAFHAAAVAAAAPAASASGGRIAKKLADAIAVRKAAGSMSGDDDDDNNDDDDDDAAAAPADAAAAPPIVPYFGATGDPTARATSLPPLPGFDAFRGANLPPLLSTAVQSTAAAVLPLLLLRRHDGLREICVVSAVHVTKNRCRSPLRVGSTCNVGEKLATYAHVADMSATCGAK